MGTPEEDKLFSDLKPKDPDVKPPAPDPNEGLAEEFHGKSLTEMASMVTEGRQKFVDLDRRVEGLTKLLTEEPEKPDPDPGTERIPDATSDPEAYYRYMHEKNVAPLAREAFERFADIEKDRAKAKFKDFERWDKEIDELVGRMPVELRAKKGSYESAYRIVRSNHLEELEEEIRTGGRGEGAGGSVSAVSEAPSTPKRVEPKPAIELSPKQDEIRQKQGLTVEEYNVWSKVNELPPGA